MSVRESQVKCEKSELVPIGTLFKFIKPFDGSREKLNSFLTNCNNAINLTSDAQKTILFKYILSQLEGKAETACFIKDFDTWEQLCEFLKTQFGEKKHYAHLLTDLQECRQSYNEPVNQFALKIETCLSKLLTEVTLSNRKKSELAGRTAAMEDLALHTFLLGLKPEISNLVRAKDPSNLNEAINFATSEEKILNLFHKRNQPHSTSHRLGSKPQQAFRPSAYNNSNPKFQSVRQPDQHNRYNQFCRYCKAPGHTLENCFKRRFNNNRFPSTSQYQRQTEPDFSKPRPSRVNFVSNTEDDYHEPQSQVRFDTDKEHCDHDHLNA